MITDSLQTTFDNFSSIMINKVDKIDFKRTLENECSEFSSAIKKRKRKRSEIPWGNRRFPENPLMEQQNRTSQTVEYNQVENGEDNYDNGDEDQLSIHANETIDEEEDINDLAMSTNKIISSHESPLKNLRPNCIRQKNAKGLED